MEFHLYLPQMRLSFERLVATAQAAEAAGFEGMAGMDHLDPPLAESQPMYDAMVTNAWLLAHTRTLKLSTLVLCDAFRHPAVLARQAVGLDNASGGRFELGLGWGSYPNDFEIFGLEPATPAARVRRMRESLQIIKALWAGETVDFEGEFFRLKGATQAPGPLGQLPIVIGGSGPKTLGLVRDFADWWNMDVRHLDKLERGKLEALRGEIGAARVSLQQMVAFARAGVDRQAVADAATRRFAAIGPVIGDGPELVDHFAGLAERGVERVYAWFCDFAPSETIAAFGEEVIAPLRAGRGRAP
jgi:alkanesulfonate monooxygenase SsuD/methylene tetrahydromethanopterin reductase-like flavin-dependent oxidoreductase (luciferase family)